MSSDSKDPTGTGGKKGYKSLVIRTGIGYKYLTGLIFSLCWLLTAQIPLFVAGVPLDVIATDFVAWMIPFTILFVTYVVRNTLREFDAMLDLSEEASGSSTHRFLLMFPTREGRDSYRERVRRMVYSPREIYLGALGALVMFVLLSPWSWQMGPYTNFGYRGTVNTVTAVRAVIVGMWAITVGFYIGLGLWLVIGIIRSVNAIGESEAAMVLRHSARYRNEEKANSQENIALKEATEFTQFRRSMREIGRFMYKFCLKLIVIGFILVWFIFAIDMSVSPLGEISPDAFIESIMIFAVVFLLFIFPQMNAHKLLSRYRDEVMSNLDETYDKIQHAFVKSLEDPAFFASNRRWQSRAEVREDSLAIDRMISHVESMGTWSFSWSTVLKLLAAAAVPLLTAILQVIGSGLLKGFMPL